MGPMDAGFVGQASLALVCTALPATVLIGSFRLTNQSDLSRPDDELMAQQITLRQLQRTEAALRAWSRRSGGDLPSTHDGLYELETMLPEGHMPLDGWGQPIYYFNPPVHGGTADFELMSFGRDGVPGGIGEDADLRLDGGGGT